MSPAYDEFFAFAQERERVRLRKEAGEPWPWTEDVGLRSAFYCNVFREDDKTTRWFKRAVRDVVAENPVQALTACVTFRWFNKVETGEAILPWLTQTNPVEDPSWHDSLYAKVDEMVRSGLTVFSGAYIISSPLGDRKINWAIQCAARTLENAPSLLLRATSLEAMHLALMDQPGLGAFMAYEIVTDLRHTAVLRGAPDLMTWANPGPGCARGLGWLHCGYNRVFSKGNSADRATMLRMMQDLLARSRAYDWSGRVWEMREVEHTLCEYDKWKRVTVKGERPKRRYHL